MGQAMRQLSSVDSKQESGLQQDTQAHPVQTFFSHYVETLEQLFVDRMVVHVDGLVSKYLVAQILPLRREAILDVSDPSLTAADRKLRGDIRKSQYHDIYDELEAMPDVRQQVIEMQAKLQDISAIARKHSAVKVLRSEHGEYGSSADDITYTLMHFARQNVCAADVQRYLDELAATFSLTSHPTNSTSVAHTVSAIALECILADESSSSQQVIDAMDAFIAAPVAAERKTPQQELEELIPICDNLFDAALLQRDAIHTALQVSGYSDMGVRIKTPMMQLEDWSATFDGDGNSNATRAALAAGTERKQAWVRARYIEMLELLIESHDDQGHYGQLQSQLKHICNALKQQKYSNVCAFQKDIQDLQSNYEVIDGLKMQVLEDILYNSHIFGFHGSRGNIRHDAKSLQETLALIVSLAEFDISDRYHTLSKDAVSTLLTNWFDAGKDAPLWNQLRQVIAQPDMLHAHIGDDDTSLRIIERLQFLAEYPECANKLIIAEATHPADAKAAMALMHITGSHVANAEATTEIVLLVESVNDVRALPETIQALTSDKVFQQHLAAIGKITVMIAHSDNRRRDGYSAGEVITSIEGEICRLQYDLWKDAVWDECQPLLHMADECGLPIYIFDGGGNDLMRGAAVNPGQTGKQHGHAAARENAPTIRTPQNTIQGEQTRLLFGYPQCAAMFLEMMVSQSMYAKAAVEKRIGVVLDGENDDAQQHHTLAKKLLHPRYQQDQMEAQRYGVLFHHHARRAFHHHTSTTIEGINPFDALYSYSGAWVSTLLANRSSRSNQRGKGDNDLQRTVAEIRGNRTALSQRAITGNLLFQLTGTFHLGLLGQLEACEVVGREAMHRLFHSSLPDRTHLVGAAQQLHMTDFNKAWRMMGKPYPRKSDKIHYYHQFQDMVADGRMPEPHITLGFMEEYGLQLARHIFYAATGQDADKVFAEHGRDFDIQDAYRTLLPELAKQLDIRHASHEAEHCAIARQERIFSEFPDRTLPEMMEMTAIALVCALSYDVRPALGPVAVRGARGVATTHEERAIDSTERVQPDIRTNLSGMYLSKGMQSAFRNMEAIEKLVVPHHLRIACKTIC